MEDDPEADIVSRVDGALEALWRGDSVAFDRLVDAEGEEGPGLGEMLEGAALPPGAFPAVPPGMPQIAGYAIRREIGRGGMGVVYEALQEGTGRAVALKVLLAGPFASEAARRRFDREVRLAARLVHANIVRILEGGHLPSGQQYYTMDLVEGVSLDRHLAAARPSTTSVLRLFLELCDAVQHAHEHGVVHRDLKPGNVLVDAEGEPHILDFGLAKATDQPEPDQAAASLSSPGQVLGSLHYLAPEQAAGAPEPIDARTDVYALGVMLFEALTGSLPFDPTGRPSEVIERIAHAPPARPSSRGRRIDGELESILLKTLEKDAADRYPSARALGDDVRRYLVGEPIAARRRHRLYFLGKKVRKHRARIAVAAAVLALPTLAIWSTVSWHESALARRQRQSLDAARTQARDEALRIQRDLEAGRTATALGPARALAAEHGDLPEAALVWIQAQYRMGRHGDDDDLINAAIAQLRTRIERDPSPGAYRALLAEISNETRGGPGRARADAVAERPVTADAWYLRSFATLDADTARERAEEALRRDPRHRLGWERLAHLCLVTERYDTALDAARALADLDRDEGRWTLFAAEVLTRAGRYPEAAERLTRAITLDPASSRAHRYRAVVHLCLEDYASAVDDYTKAIELKTGDDTWERYARATPLWITGRIGDVVADYGAFREERGFTTYADARLFLVLHHEARRLEQEGRPDQAVRYRTEADRVLAAGRRGAAAGSWLEQILACLGDDLTPEELIAAADPAFAEQTCEAFYYAGEASLLAGRTGDAREMFARCVQTGVALDPDSSAMDAMNEYHLARWRLEGLEGSDEATEGGLRDKGAMGQRD